MISDNYKRQLLKEVKNIDLLSEQKYDFEKLIKAITDEEDDKAILELIKNLGILSKEKLIHNFNPIHDKIIELLYKYLGATKVDNLFEELKETSNISFEKLLNQLDELIGLNEVKQQVQDLLSYNQIQCLREKAGLRRTNKTLHMAFLGNPGTAKTTVARIIGRMYKSMGILSKGHFIEVSRSDLIAEYQGQTAIKVKKLIKRARGGVLFIDEAYSITENNNSDSYGREGLTELTKALEDYRNDLVVIVAGYPDLMDQFFESNPGLKSRFNTFILFNDYSLDELVQIFIYICKQNDYVITEEGIECIRDTLAIKLKEKDSKFSNARFIRNLFDDIVVQQSKRLSENIEKITKQNFMLITKNDIIQS